MPALHFAPRFRPWSWALAEDGNEAFSAEQRSSTPYTDDWKKWIEVSDRSRVGNVFTVLQKSEAGDFRAPATGFPNHRVQSSFCIVNSLIRLAQHLESHPMPPLLLGHGNVEPYAAGLLR